MTRSATYRFRTTFSAPLPFVFRWCTDYGATDPSLEGESYRRKVLERTRRRIVYEDLEETPSGWAWARHVVTLRPPGHWHSDSIGNRRTYRLDYDLRTLRDGRTELRFVGRRTTVPGGSKNPSARAFDLSMKRSWIRFRKELERDYRAASRPAARPTRR